MSLTLKSSGEAGCVAESAARAIRFKVSTTTPAIRMSFMADIMPLGGAAYNHRQADNLAEPDSKAYIHRIHGVPGGIAMPTVQKWGNSLGIRVPKSIAEQVDLRDGTEIEF